MPKLTVQIVIYNSINYLNDVMLSLFDQNYKDIDVVAIICGNEDGSKEFLIKHYPQVRIIDPGKNLGFAGGHNLGFRESRGEFIQLIGPDQLLESDYFEKLLRAFEDPQIASATGKLFQYNFTTHEKSKKLDSTGVVIYKSGRARDRGQHEEDRGQYDEQKEVAAISGAAAMFRKSALEEMGYFDEDFLMYWEDVDLSLRFLHAGYKNVFVPDAIGYHGRGSGSSEGGVFNVKSFMKTRSKRSRFVRELNYKNHLFVVIKNYPRIYVSFLIREILMFGFTLLFEITTFRILPILFKQLPSMLEKRKTILKNSKISSDEFSRYFTQDNNHLA